MSFVFATPEYVAAAASELSSIGSSMSSANVMAAVPTSGVVAAGADGVSAQIAALFAAHSQIYQAVSEQAALFHQRFVELMSTAGGLYATTEATNASLSAVTPTSAGAAAAARTGGAGVSPLTGVQQMIPVPSTVSGVTAPLAGSDVTGAAPAHSGVAVPGAALAGPAAPTGGIAMGGTYGAAAHVDSIDMTRAASGVDVTGGPATAVGGPMFGSMMAPIATRRSASEDRSTEQHFDVASTAQPQDQAVAETVETPVVADESVESSRMGEFAAGQLYPSRTGNFYRYPGSDGDSAAKIAAPA